MSELLDAHPIARKMLEQQTIYCRCMDDQQPPSDDDKMKFIGGFLAGMTYALEETFAGRKDQARANLVEFMAMWLAEIARSKLNDNVSPSDPAA